MQEVLGGRDAGELPPEEFWGPIQADVVNRFGGVEPWAVEDIIAGDLIQESLFKQLRDRAIASRELIGVADLDDIGGTMESGYDYIFPECPSSLSNSMENSGYSGLCKIVESDGWTHLPSVTTRTVANGGKTE